MPLLNNASQLYVGHSPVVSVYAGLVKVWPSIEPPPVVTHIGTRTSNPVNTGGAITMPAGVQTGDVLVVTVGLSSSSRAITFTGVTEVANQSVSGHRCAIGLGTYTGAAVSYTLATAFSHALTITALRGVVTTGRVVGQALITSGSAPPMITPAIAPVGTMAGFSVVSRSSSAGTTFTPEAGVTELFDLVTATNITSQAGGLVDMTVHTDGSTAWGQAVNVGGNGSVFTLGLAFS